MKDERGIALPLALMVMLVVSLLGTALWHYSITDTLHVFRDKKSLQAYYLARSGADAVAEYIINNPGCSIIGTEAEPRISTTVELIDSGTVQNIPVEIKVYRKSDKPKEIIIDSTATVDDVTQNALLTVTVMEGSGFEYAIYAASNLTFKNKTKIVKFGTEDGADVGYAGSQNIEDLKIQSDIIGDLIPCDYTYPPISFPHFEEDNSTLSVNGGTQKISSNSYYSGGITVANSAELQFDTTDGDLIIRADTVRLHNSGKISIIGNGRVMLYVDDSLTLDNSATNNEGSAVLERLTVFVGKNVDLKNSSQFNGYIYAPQASLDMDNGNKVVGAIIVDDIVMFNSSRLEYKKPDPDILEMPAWTSTDYQKGFWE